jgi:hypothetical protein
LPWKAQAIGDILPVQGIRRLIEAGHVLWPCHGRSTPNSGRLDGRSGVVS